MRTWIKIFIITGIIIFVDAMVTSYLNNEYQFYDRRLTELSLLVENQESDKAKEIIDELYAHWSGAYEVWETLADHSEIEQIDMLFTKLYKYYPDDNEHETLSDIIELYRLIGFTTKRYKVTLVNIL